jgi:hypothetical protein
MNLHYFLLSSACPLLHFLGAAGLEANVLHCDPPLRFSMYYYDATLGSSSHGSGVAIHPKVHTLYKFRYSKIAGKGEGGWLGGVGRVCPLVVCMNERSLSV